METTMAFGEQLLRLRDVERKTGLGRSTIYRYMADGSFPRPVQVAPAVVRWKDTELNAWISSLAPTAGASLPK